MIPNLSKEMIDLLQQLRKRLRSEFNADLKLSQVDIIDALLLLVEKSRDQRTQLLFADLEDMMGLELRRIKKPEQALATKASTNMYRGQVVNEPVKLDSSSKRSARVITTQTRIYRGQIVA
ncbi:MAG: hypothetical protein ACJAYK_001759 [Crocinitomicaceae bacterium]|jgi:hypothetical protein